MYVVAYNNSTLGKSAYGTVASEYVMADPSTTNMHVSSVYVRLSGTGTTYAENGWCSEFTLLGRKVRYFAVYSVNGKYSHDHYQDAALDSNNSFTVRNVTGSNLWKWYLNGVEKYSYDMGGWKQGWSTCSSERGDTTDTNYSHFWDLRSRDNAGTWYNWSAKQILTDNDSGYGMMPGTPVTEVYVVSGY